MTPEQIYEQATRTLDFANSLMTYSAVLVGVMAIILTALSVFLQFKGKNARDREIRAAVQKFADELSEDAAIREAFIQNVLKDARITDTLKRTVSEAASSRLEQVLTDDYIIDLRNAVVQNLEKSRKEKENKEDDNEDVPF